MRESWNQTHNVPIAGQLHYTLSHNLHMHSLNGKQTVRRKCTKQTNKKSCTKLVYPVKLIPSWFIFLFIFSTQFPLLGINHHPTSCLDNYSPIYLVLVTCLSFSQLSKGSFVAVSLCSHTTVLWMWHRATSSFFCIISSHNGIILIIYDSVALLDSFSLPTCFCNHLNMAGVIYHKDYYKRCMLTFNIHCICFMTEEKPFKLKSGGVKLCCWG